MNTPTHQPIQYENIFRAKNTLYARTYDPNTNESTTKAVKYIPSLFIKTKDESPYKSVLTKENLTEINYSSMKDYRDAQNVFKSSNIQTFGNKTQEQGYIRENWPNPTESDHSFHTFFFDIETLVDDDSVSKKVSRQDWKPCSHERSAMAKISSIQVYDTKSKEFYIFGLQKDWHNESNFVSEQGKINYWNMSSEENLLKAFMGLLHRRNPTVLSGWNSAGYDIPYITNRVIRVLDKRDDLYIFDSRASEWRFNTECLEGSYVKQLSAVGLIQHKEVETNFGKQDEFEWKGYFLEDYLDLYKKYTFTTLTSYSLSNVAIHELGTDKVNHDEHADFGEFYRNSFDKFIVYGITDVEILIYLNEKLKLLDLAKSIAYICGVNLDNIRGTVAQWNSYMYNEHFNKGLILPTSNPFEKDETFFNHVNNMVNLSEDKAEYFKELYDHVDEENGSNSWRSQRFAGGMTRGTGKFWKWCFSLDFASLYPSAIMWANIGIDTLVLPKDLPKECLDIKAKYAIFYPKHTEPKDLIKYDFDYVQNVLGNKEIVEEIRKVLDKYNLSMTPNGIFFRKDERSILSSTMEYLISNRKVYKKQMKSVDAKIEELKKTDYSKEEMYSLESDRDKFNVYQMGLKILANSAYGSLSMEATLFAGHSEYFSTAITSSARIANLLVGQANTKKICELSNTEAKETQYGFKSYLDCIPQEDTDSCLGDSSIYINAEKITIEDFYESAIGDIERRGKHNYIRHLSEGYSTLSLNKFTGSIESKSVKYIMAHKVNKRMFKIKHKDAEITVTEDHSVIIKRGHEYMDVKPIEIKKGDKIIKI